MSAENIVSGAADTAKSAVTTPVKWAKSNPWAFAFLLVVAMFVFVRFSGKISVYLQQKAATGSKLWTRIAKLAGAVTALAVIGYVAQKITGNSFFDALPLMAVAFPASDYLAIRDETGNRVSLLTPGTAEKSRIFNFQAPRELHAGFPIKVNSVNFSLKATLTQAASVADPIPWDALHVMCAGLDVRSPRFDVMARKEDLSGPVLKHMDEFICRGYDYSGDEIIADISSTAATYAVTIYFAYQFEQRWAAKPEEFALFAGWLQGTQFTFWLNTATSLAAYSTSSTFAGTDVELRAGFRYSIGAVQGDARGAYGVPPLVNRRVIKTPAQGQIDIPFVGLGSTGPANTNTGAGERIVAAVLLSDEVGLPGPGTVTDITEIGCEALGILNTENVDHFVMAKVPRTPRENVSDWDGEGTTRAFSQRWPWTLSHHSDLGNVLHDTDLMGMPLVLPSMGTKITKLPRLKGDITVHARRTSPPSTGQHCLYVLSLRDIDPSYGTQMLASAGVQGQTTRAVSHDADAAVSSGKVSPASYVGIPQVIKGSKA